MTNNYQKLCSELFPLYETWKSAVLDAKKAMRDFARAENEEEIRQARERFKEAKQKAEQAKQEYEDKAYERVGFEGEEITYKDALLLSFLKEKIGDFSWNQENGRVSYIDFSRKYFSSAGRVSYINASGRDFSSPIYFPDNLQALYLQNAIIKNSENLKLPNNLQLLDLDHATVQNPENLKFPDNLQVIWLKGATMNEAFRKKLREYKKRNSNVEIYGVKL
jgi:hypothetical protein